jgi:hypothetical protein
MIWNSQSGSKHVAGIGKARSTETPAGIGGVGCENVPPGRNTTVVIDAPASALPWFLTVTIQVPPPTLAETRLRIGDRDEVGQPSLRAPWRDTLGVERLNLPVLAGRRVDGHHVQLDLALEDHEALEELLADPGMLADVRAVDLERLVGSELGVEELGHRSRLLTASRIGDLLAQLDIVLRRVVHVDRSEVNARGEFVGPRLPTHELDCVLKGCHARASSNQTNAGIIRSEP